MITSLWNAQEIELALKSSNELSLKHDAKESNVGADDDDHWQNINENLVKPDHLVIENIDGDDDHERPYKLGNILEVIIPTQKRVNNDF